MSEEPPSAEGTAEDAAKIRALRELIPATGAGIYLDTAYRGPLPAETAAAMRDADDWELRVGRATEGRADDMAQRVEEARAVLAALLLADPSEIVLTSGVDTAIALAARIAPANQLVVTHAVDPNTGVASLGRRIPRKNDTWVAADASLAAGATPFEAAALDAEFVVFAADRWLLGPEETAGLWIGPRARAARIDVLPSMGLGRSSDFPAALGVSRTAALGLARSVGWLEMYVGLEWAYARTRRLAERLFDQLSATESVMVATRRDMLAGIVSFSVAGWTLENVLEEVRRSVFAIVGRSHDGDWVRASVAWFNTEEELDRFASAVAEIARHTPETLPRRPRLIVH